MRLFLILGSLILINITYLGAKSEFVKYQYRASWPINRLYPYVRDLDEFKEIIITEDSHPGYKEELMHTDKKALEIDINEDGSIFGIIFDLKNSTPRLFYLNPNETIMQEFSLAGGFRDSNPTLTRNGEKIFFSSDRFGNKEIYLAEFANYRTNYGYTVNLIVDNHQENKSPSVDADGKFLAYVSDKERGNNLIYVRNLETGEESVPNDDTHNCSDPHLSYNGQHVTYTSYFNKNYDVYAANLNKKTLVNISDHASVDKNSMISEDGNRVVFQSDRSAMNDIYMLDQNDLTLFNLTHDQKANDISPVMSSDGQIIAFESRGKWETISVKVIDFNRKLILKFLAKGEPHVKPALSKNGNILMFYIHGDIYRIDLSKIKDNRGT